MRKLRHGSLTALILLMLSRCSSAQVPVDHSLAVEITNKGNTSVLELTEGKAKISAERITYDAATRAFTLENKVAITVIQDKQHSMRFTGDRATIKGEQIELQIDGGSANEVDYDGPIRELAAALRPDHPFMTYRVKWYFSVFRSSSSGEALYDGQKGTLSVITIYQDSDGENGTYDRRHVLYSGVNDDKLRQYAKDSAANAILNARQGAVEPFGFGALRDYGCTPDDVR